MNRQDYDDKRLSTFNGDANLLFYPMSVTAAWGKHENKFWRKSLFCQLIFYTRFIPYRI